MTYCTNQPIAFQRTYEDFLNLQASKNDKSKSSSHKLPLSARLPSSASSRSKILVPGSKPGSTSGVSPERKRSTSARTSSTTTSSLDLNQNSKSPPPKPLPPSTSSGIRKYHKSSQPPLQHSKSLFNCRLTFDLSYSVINRFIARR